MLPNNIHGSPWQTGDRHGPNGIRRHSLGNKRCETEEGVPTACQVSMLQGSASSAPEETYQEVMTSVGSLPRDEGSPPALRAAPGIDCAVFRQVRVWVTECPGTS